MIIELNIWDWVLNSFGIGLLILMGLGIFQLLQEIYHNWQFDRYIRDKDSRSHGSTSGGKDER